MFHTAIHRSANFLFQIGFNGRDHQKKHHQKTIEEQGLIAQFESE